LFSREVWGPQKDKRNNVLYQRIKIGARHQDRAKRYLVEEYAMSDLYSNQKIKDYSKIKSSLLHIHV
jgi:hypothetical protein